MASKKVTLIVKPTKQKREFEKAHAERLLKLKNSCFVLPSDSEFEFVDNGFRTKRNKEASKGKSTKATDK